MAAIAAHTARSKGVPPETDSGTSNAVSSPEKYARSCARAAAATGPSGGTGRTGEPPKCTRHTPTSSTATPSSPIGVGSTLQRIDPFWLARQPHGQPGLADRRYPQVASDLGGRDGQRHDDVPHHRWARSCGAGRRRLRRRVRFYRLDRRVPRSGRHHDKGHRRLRGRHGRGAAHRMAGDAAVAAGHAHAHRRHPDPCRPGRHARRRGHPGLRHRGTKLDERPRRGDTFDKGTLMDNPLLIAIVGGVLLLLLVVLLIMSRIKVAGPNEAFIVTGRKGRAIQAADGSRATDLSGQKVVMGASVFVMPVVQKLHRLDLSSRRIHVEIQGAVSKQGIRANLQGLGRPEAARVLKEAAIAEARARQAAEQERLLAEESIAGAQRNLALKQAGIQAEIDAARAKSAAAGPLAQAERDQAILTEQQKVAERNAELKERQLDTEVRKPADAARYKIEQEAEAARRAAVLRADAERQATIAAAQAQAEHARLIGEGERSRRAALAEATAIEGAKQGEAEQRRRTAIAEAVEREGAAEGSAILARGQAEAEAMRRKAESFAEYGQAAVLDLLVRVLPQVVEAASRPMSGIDKMTVISTDGAASLSRSVAANVAQGLQLGSDLTGIDLAKLLARLGGTAVEDDNGRAKTAVEAPAKPAPAKPASAKP